MTPIFTLKYRVIRDAQRLSYLGDRNRIFPRIAGYKNVTHDVAVVILGEAKHDIVGVGRVERVDGVEWEYPLLPKTTLTTL